MKMLLLTLALLFPLSGGSLGIGIDVLPEAFGFAARRVGFTVDLHLTSCTASRCIWNVGHSVEIAADRSQESLDIYRLEATIDRASADEVSSVARYEQACLAIVSLVERGASLADLRLAAQAISSPSGHVLNSIPIDNSERMINLYSSLARAPGDMRPIAKRCGAVAS